MSLDSLSQTELLFGPSPVHRLHRLGEHLGAKVELWARREDCNAGRSALPRAEQRGSVDGISVSCCQKRASVCQLARRRG